MRDQLRHRDRTGGGGRCRHGHVYNFDYQYGFTFAIKALVALALGGIGNVFGASGGRPSARFIENLAAYYVGQAWIEVASYGVFMLVLIFLPQGLFGRGGLVKKV